MPISVISSLLSVGDLPSCFISYASFGLHNGKCVSVCLVMCVWVLLIIFLPDGLFSFSMSNVSYVQKARKIIMIGEPPHCRLFHNSLHLQKNLIYVHFRLLYISLES